MGKNGKCSICVAFSPKEYGLLLEAIAKKAEQEQRTVKISDFIRSALVAAGVPVEHKVLG